MSPVACVGVTQVTMGIDERRHHRLALKVDDGAARRPLHRAACADLRDSRPFDHEGEFSIAGRPSPVIRRAPSKSIGPVPVPGVCASRRSRPAPRRSSAHASRVIITLTKFATISKTRRIRRSSLFRNVRRLSE